jgi:thymidylate synthase (FAD)
VDFGEFINAVTTSFFIVWGTNRITTHQIVRHKTLDFLQKSNRYREVTKDDISVLPLEIINRIELAPNDHKSTIEHFYLDHVNYLYEKYKFLRKNGIKKEAARYLLPQFQKTNIVISGINRYIEDFIKQRISSAAQPEIRIIAEIMKDLQNTTPMHEEVDFKKPTGKEIW